MPSTADEILTLPEAAARAGLNLGKLMRRLSKNLPGDDALRAMLITAGHRRHVRAGDLDRLKELVTGGQK